MDLIEVFCSTNSMMTQTAQKAGLNAERWTKDDFDLETEEGYQAAEQRLRELRPRRLWISPECGPFFPNAEHQPTNSRTDDKIDTKT